MLSVLSMNTWTGMWDNDRDSIRHNPKRHQECNNAPYLRITFLALVYCWRTALVTVVLSSLWGAIVAIRYLMTFQAYLSSVILGSRFVEVRITGVESSHRGTSRICS